MAIHPTDANGLLPAGIHDCTIEEIAAVFGHFHSSNRRVKLLRGLQAYLSRLREVGIGVFLYIDGSFVTSEGAPHDIDVLLVLRDDADLAQQVPPFEYNLRSGRYSSWPCSSVSKENLSSGRVF
jgi:hypothetical protein